MRMTTMLKAVSAVSALALTACADNLIIPEIPQEITVAPPAPSPAYQVVAPGQQALVLDQSIRDPAGRPVFRPIGDVQQQYGMAQTQFYMQNTGQACAQMADLQGLETRNEQLQAYQVRLNAAHQAVIAAVARKQAQVADAQFRQTVLEILDGISTVAQFYFAGRIKASGDYKATVIAGEVSSLVRGLSYYDIATLNLSLTQLIVQVMGLYSQDMQLYGERLAVYTGETRLWLTSMVDGCVQAQYLRPAPVVATQLVPAQQGVPVGAPPPGVIPPGAAPGSQIISHQPPIPGR